MEILIKGVLKKAIITDNEVKIGRTKINNNDIAEIKYQLGKWSENGFLTFCTDTEGENIEKIEDTNWNKNSIQFRKTQNEKVQEVLKYFEDRVTLTDIKKVAVDKEEDLKRKEKELKESGEIYCPKCLSTQVQAGKKGFRTGKAVTGSLIMGPAGLLAGSFGSKKVELMCLNCGHRWEPKRK